MRHREKNRTEGEKREGAHGTRLPGTKRKRVKKKT